MDRNKSGRTAFTKPYEFIGFGAMDVTKPYQFIGFVPGVRDDAVGWVVVPRRSDETGPPTQGGYKVPKNGLERRGPFWEARWGGDPIKNSLQPTEFNPY